MTIRPPVSGSSAAISCGERMGGEMEGEERERGGGFHGR